MGVTSTQDVTGRQHPWLQHLRESLEKGEGLYSFWRERENQEALGLPFPHNLKSWETRGSSDAELSLSSLEECRRDAAGRKGPKGLLLVGHEKVLVVLD